MSYSDNPYNAPINPYGDEPTGSSQTPATDAAGKLKLPAIAMLVLAPLSIISMAVDFGFRIVNINSGNVPVIVDAPGAAQGAIIGVYVGAGVDLLAIFCQIGVIFGAISMLKVKSYNTALVASVISVIPCLSACCIAGVPFGIWALVVLNDSSVKAAFRQ